jgi:hypothetical protein
MQMNISIMLINLLIPAYPMPGGAHPLCGGLAPSYPHPIPRNVTRYMPVWDMALYLMFNAQTACALRYEPLAAYTVPEMHREDGAMQGASLLTSC